MRIRTIKPEWLDDEKLIMCSSDARVLSIALVLLADDHGNGRIVEQVLAVRVFPRTPKVFAASLRELEAMRFVVIYVVECQTYYHIRTWDKHQRIDNAGKPRVPKYLPELSEFRGETPQLAEFRRLTPTKTPTKTPTSSKAPTPERIEAEAVVLEHRRLLREVRKLDVPESVSDTAAADGRKVLKQWPSRWSEMLALFVAEESKFLIKFHWPLSALLRFADDYETKLRNRGRSGSKSVEQIEAEAAAYDDMLRKRAEEAELV